MTPEQLLLSALSAVVSVLVFVCKRLLKSSDQCEQDRRELRGEIEKIKQQHSRAEGHLDAVAQCAVPGCTMREITNRAQHAT